MYYVYIIRCVDNSLYTGITNHLTRRLLMHNRGVGARYTRGRLPVALVYAETCPDRSHALKREIAIKRLSKEQKERLISTMVT
jgi:putative endonuclease